MPAPLPGRAVVEEFRRRVAEWYGRHGDRALPWRGAADPWAVLAAAVLLRKTSAARVAKVYGEFLRRFPRPGALLPASVEEVEELIRPLGIEHRRARQLKEIAEHVEGRWGGRIPCDREELKGLPGVGDYAAAEVLLVACGRPAPLLDRNMARVVERVFGVKPARRRPHTDPGMWAFAEMLVPRDPEEAKAFNYGVLDLARKVCTARKPRCGECPLRDMCRHHRKRRGAG